MKQIMSSLLVLCILLLMSYVVQAQIINVKGKVTDENGAAVSSASIRLKNSKKGAVSGEDGTFSIQTNDKSTIIVSALGYISREIATTGKDNLLIIIKKSDVALNEVVVTALGVKREKRNLTFSSQEIKSEDLVRSKEPNLINAIAGKVAGVQVTSSSGAPGASSRIVIRGITSIFGNNEALIVLDGIPIDNSETGAVNAGPGSNRLVDIDPSIIENVNVLKGAAATALYGSAGARGVVIITTKTGAGNKKPLISLSSDISMENGLFPQIQSKYSQGDRRVIDGVTYDAQYYNGEDRKTSSSWGALMDTLKVNGLPVQKHNQLKEFFNTGITSNTTLGIGGSSNPGSSYYMSYSYFDQKGIVPTTDFKRHSFFSKYTTKISDKITSTFQLNYANSQSNRLPEGYNLESPVWTIFTAPISYNLKPYLNANGSQRLYRFSRNNPYWVLDNIYTHGTVNRFLPVVTISYNPLKWLTVTERVGADIYSEQVKYYEATGSSANAKGVIVDRFSNFRQFNHDLIIQGRKQFGNFDVDLLIGNNILSTYSQSSQARGVGLSIGGAFDNVSNASTQTYSEGHYLTRKVGFYSQANIEYKRILNLAITGRYDGSSVLSKDKSFYPYGSVAAGFIFSELIKNKSSFFNFGKLRLSYATVGNDNVGAYSLNTPFYSANTGGISFPYLGQSGFLLSSTLGNPQLKNELAKEFEIGLETKMFNSRIGLEVSYFNKKIEDGIIPGVTIAPSTGYNGTTVNSARLQTKGLEILLTAAIVKNGKFSWDATINFTKLNNKVLALASDLQQISVGFTQAIVGQPYGVKFGSRYARTASGELLIDAAGLPFADANQGIVGNISPDWMGGISNNIRYGQFSLNFFFDVKKGGDIENNVDGYGYFYGTPKVTENRGLRVVQGISTVDNKPNTIAVKGQNYYRRLNTLLEPVIQDGSYIKLRNVSLSYNIKSTVLNKTPFKNATITITGRNLWIYAPHFTGGDPEVSSFGSSNGAQGIYSFSTPTSRSVNCSLKFTF